MNIVLPFAIAAILGLLVCLNFGAVQYRLLQSALHAKGLGGTSVSLGGSLSDGVFAGVGLLLADAFISGDAATVQIWKFFIVAILGGYGVYNTILRRATSKKLATSTGNFGTLGAGFGVGLFNYSHIFFWIATASLVRFWGMGYLDTTSKLAWVIGATLGVLAGNLTTVSFFTAKSVNNTVIAMALMSRVFGLLLLVVSGTVALSLFTE